MPYISSASNLPTPCAHPPRRCNKPLDEGIVIHNSHLSHAVAPEGGRLRFEARPVTSFSFDETGALHTEFAPGDPLCMNADLVICASGLQTDEIPLEGVDMARTPRGFVAVDPVSFRTSVPGLYAAGDIANGPSLIARAIGHGRQAAIAVHKALSGIDPAENIDIWIDETGRVREDHVPALPAPHVVAFKEIMHADYHEHARRPDPALLPPATARNWRLPNSPAGSRPKPPLPRPDAVCIAATAWNAVHAWKAAPDTSSK